MKIRIKDKKVDFKIYNPGGNITALVINKNNLSKKEINDAILSKYSEVEQVGFIYKNNLEMAGGEFCINASRCALYYLYENNKKLKINILNRVITGEVLDNNIISINYKLDKYLITEYEEYSVVDLDGISLVFLNKEENNKLLKNINNKNIFNIIKNKLKNININSKALGIVLTKDNNIYPFIWVRDIDTLYFETSCGSASIAYSLINYKKTNITEYVINQPSGYSIEIKIEKDLIKFKGFIERR